MSAERVNLLFTEGRPTFESGYACHWIISFLLVLAALVRPSGAQDSSCLSELVPCVQYINTKQAPPSSCCKPLHTLIKSDLQCLCSMLSGTTAGVNITQAQLLPARCGEKVNAALCKSSSKTLSSFEGELPVKRAVMVAALSVIVQLIWGLIMYVH